MRTEVASFVGHVVIICGMAVDVEFVVASGCRWGRYICDAYPDQTGTFHAQAASLSFCDREIDRMWSWLAKICVTGGTSPEGLIASEYQQSRAAVHDTVIAEVCLS